MIHAQDPCGQPNARLQDQHLLNKTLFEQCYLMTNKDYFNVLVGGIYTVIRSKAYVSTEEMGDQYCLLGPYKEQCARTEVEEQEFHVGSPLHTAVCRMRERGYQVS